MEKNIENDSMSRLQRHYSKSRKIDKVILQWNDINYSVREKDSKKSSLFRPVYKVKQILKSVSGEAESGQLLAIMGPTGCGKTSLLNILSSRVPSGGSTNASLSGNLFINGLPRDDIEFRKASAYVLQDDKLYAHLTVFETLLLAAHFYSADEVTMEAKEALVGDVISELGLTKVRNTIIGDEKVRGVSGGERKRANIGVQLISDPAVLFLDEPTSGLDSFQAQAVMESMKTLAENGRLVVSVIHQPRSSIYEMFDRLFLLSEGRTIYQGTAKGAVSYFALLGFICPSLFNPSDYFLDILSPDNRSDELESITNRRIEVLGKCWEKYSKSNPCALELSKKPLSFTPNPLTFSRFILNFKILCWRAWTEQSRQIPFHMIKMTITIFFALLIGGIYSNSKDDQKGVVNRIGVLFVICINQGFNGAINVLNTFPKEKIIVNRERSTDAYDTFSYFIAKFVVEMPLNLLPCVVFIIITYQLVGLNPDSFGLAILILMYEVLTGIALGLCVSAATPSIELANALGIPCVVIALLFAGYYVNVSSLPIVANWIPNFSFIKWAFEGLAINEFAGKTFSCTGSTGQCYRTGEEVLQIFSYNNSTISDAMFGESMVLIGFVVVAITTLHFGKLTYIKMGHKGRNMA